jgi:hypothetical protein
MRTTDSNLILNEYISKTDWKDMYQWKRISSKGNTEIISELLLKDFHKIKWSMDGLRTQKFKIETHQGYCQMNTSIDQFTEKRFCRALYNEYNTNPHHLLGKVIDYEVPLTEPNQKKVTGKKINQGDIDLITQKNNELLFIEAKKSNSTESLLKAILEIFVYVIRLKKYNLLNQFKKEYGIIRNKKIVPGILTFKDSTSGKQILEIENYPFFLQLIGIINQEFNKNGISELEFFIVEQPNDNYDKLLKSLPTLPNSKQKKILLNRSINLVQYFPLYVNNSALFQDKLNNNVDVVLLEMLLRSYLFYDKQEAVKYIILRINSIHDEYDTYKKISPKNEILNKKIHEFAKINIPFIDAYLKIAKDYIFPEFLDINLRLLNPSRNKILVPIISNFKSELVLDKLIHAYNNIRIISSKDYDGISSQLKDLEDEEIIISALCNYDSYKIVPLLIESIHTGAIGSVKSKVVNKLLTFISKQEILDLLPDFNNPDSWMTQALTNMKENSDWIKDYLNRK